MQLGVSGVRDRQTYPQTHGQTDILVVNARLTTPLDKNATSTKLGICGENVGLPVHVHAYVAFAACCNVCAPPPPVLLRHPEHGTAALMQTCTFLVFGVGSIKSN